LTNLKIQKSILDNQDNNNLKKKIDKRIINIEDKIINLQKYFIDDDEIQNKALDKVKSIQESRKAINKYKELQQ
jgi:hypothetical protein